MLEQLRYFRESKNEFVADSGIYEIQEGVFFEDIRL